MSAEAAKCAFEKIKDHILRKGGTQEKKAKIVVASVEGDIHDIGKNIVKVLLENYGFEVIDLGRDVSPEAVLQAVVSEKAPLCGLSALMTTTVPAMAQTVALIKENAPFCKTMVGGAVITQETADLIGADKYAKDAMEGVRYAETIAK
jgi:5-methyltetrahydrofolate--homocysteine methyltransferase